MIWFIILQVLFLYSSFGESIKCHMYSADMTTSAEVNCPGSVCQICGRLITYWFNCDNAVKKRSLIVAYNTSQPKLIGGCPIPDRNEYCLLCEGDLCNEKNFTDLMLTGKAIKKCFYCPESSDCSKPQMKYCQGLGVGYLCVTIKRNALTTKDCMSEINYKRTCLHRSAAKSVKCTFCKDDSCNRVDTDNFKCYSCDGGSDCLSAQNITAATTVNCENYLGTYSCAIFIRSTDYVVRNCLNDFFYKDFCAKNPDLCLLCGDSLCNGFAVDPADYMFEVIIKSSCVQCLESNTTCPVQQITAPSYTKCPKPFLQAGPQCFRYTFNDSGTRYGCISDDPHFCDERDCYTCNDAMCNHPYVLSQKCVQCNSTDNAYCATNSHLIVPKPCNKPSAHGHMGCFAQQQLTGKQTIQILQLVAW